VQVGGLPQRYCTSTCRKLADKERRKAKAAEDATEDLPDLAAALAPPMPASAVEEPAGQPTEQPAAVVRSGRDHDYRALASAPPIESDAHAHRARERNRDADRRFVAAVAPMLDQGARERAR